MIKPIKGFSIFAGAILTLSACGGAGNSSFSSPSGSTAQGSSPAFVPAAAGSAQSPNGQQISSMLVNAPEPRLDLGVGRNHPLITSPIINDAGAFTNGPIIEGTNTADGYGVEGVTSGGGAGLYGIAANTSPIFTAGVYAAGVGPGAEGLYGIAKGSGYGVYGVSVAGTGVAGVTSNPTGFGGAFTNTTASGDAVNIISTGGTGLQVASTTGRAISSISSGGGIGAYAESHDNATTVLANEFGSGLAIDADGDSGSALLATSSVSGTGTLLATNFSSTGWGGYTKGGFIGFQSQDTVTNGFPIVGQNSAGTDVFWITDAGDAEFAGVLHTTIAPPGRHGLVRTFAPSVASPTTEDTGSAQLVGGSATVHLDSTFAQTIDSARPYQVMLTPDGDTHGLYVASKSPSGFTVREVQGGRSSISFDYHIYAPTAGHANERATLVTGTQGPRLPTPMRYVAKPAPQSIR